MARICGKLSPATLQSHFYQTNGRKLSVRFDAGSTHARRGFRIKLKAVPYDSDKSVSILHLFLVQKC